MYLDCKLGMLFTLSCLKCVYYRRLPSFMIWLMLTLHVCHAGPNKPCYL